MKIHILLATFQSERFLAEQLDSILLQDYGDFLLFIRDGGSTDSTLSIIREYEKKDSRIRFLGRKKEGAKENFSNLMQEGSGGDLYLFSDHDDVWFPHKLSTLLKLYRELETENPPGIPLLVFSDSTVTDDSLHVISPSLFRYQNLDPENMDLSRLLLQNVPSGNTMLFNEALRLKAGTIPEKAVMHDHFMALAISVFGKYTYCREPLLFYRQHKKNIYGARAYSPAGFFRKLLAGPQAIRRRFYENIEQAGSFLELFEKELAPEEKLMLSSLVMLEKKGFWERRKILWKYHIRKSGFFRNLGMYIIV